MLVRNGLAEIKIWIVRQMLHISVIRGPWKSRVRLFAKKAHTDGQVLCPGRVGPIPCERFWCHDVQRHAIVLNIFRALNFLANERKQFFL